MYSTNFALELSRRSCSAPKRSRTAADDEPARFVDDDQLICGEILEGLNSSGRPLDVDPEHPRVSAEAKGQREIALRGVTRPAVHHLPLRARRARHPHARADSAAVRPGSERPHAQPVATIAAVVSKEMRR